VFEYRRGVVKFEATKIYINLIWKQHD